MTGFPVKHLTRARIGITAIPGPIEGAGLPALAVAGGALWFSETSAAVVSRIEAQSPTIAGLSPTTSAIRRWYAYPVARLRRKRGFVEFTRSIADAVSPISRHYAD